MRTLAIPFLLGVSLAAGGCASTGNQGPSDAGDILMTEQELREFHGLDAAYLIRSQMVVWGIPKRAGQSMWIPPVKLNGEAVWFATGHPTDSEGLESILVEDIARIECSRDRYGTPKELNIILRRG